MNEQEVRALIARLLEVDWESVPVLRDTADMIVRGMTAERFSAARGWVRRQSELPDHPHNQETWTHTIAGTARIFQEGTQVVSLKPGYLHHTPARTTHRIEYDEGYEGIEIEILDSPPGGKAP